MEDMMLSANTSRQDLEPAVPRIVGDYVHVYMPQPDVFAGPDSLRFKAGQRYDDWVPNDHTVIKGDDGCWHSLGITHPKPPDYNPPQWSGNIHEAEWQLYHAVSPGGTLRDILKPGAWEDAPKVLPPEARPGEIEACYAPYIVRRDGLYHMFYGPSPMRLATSPDLYHWTPQGPLFEQEGAARDPNILQYNDQYIIYYTAGRSVFARSSTDLRNWSSQPIEVFKMRRGGCPESPFVLSYGSHFYLFWCLWDSNDIVYGPYDNRVFVFRSDNPFDFNTATPQVAQLNAHAPEIFQDEDGDWFMSSVEWPHRGLSIAPLKWE